MQQPERDSAALRLAKSFGIANNGLVIGGRSVAQLRAIAGERPFYAYDSRLIRERIAELRVALPSIAIKYAVKANPLPALLRDVAPLVDGFDCASAREVELALAAGVAPDKISFAGPGKGREELAAAIAAAIVIVIESERELSILDELARGAGRRPPVMLRINPDYSLRAGAMKMGGEASHFGMDASDIAALLPRLHDHAIDFLGFHVFAGSQLLDQETLEFAHVEAIKLCERLGNAAPIQRFNIGGGFGIPYHEDQKPIDLLHLGGALQQELGRFKGRPPAASFEIELGRYLVGEAGVYVCTVLDRKLSRGEVFLITDGGMHHHLAATGNLGGLFRRNYPILVGNKISTEDRETVTVTGRLCTPLDVLGRKVSLPRCSPGDQIVVFQSGAYGPSASPVHFLGHPAPAELYL